MIRKTGIVTSAKMTGTVTVTVHRQVVHKLYKKGYRVSKKFLADSKGFDLRAGDQVVIGECRPLSKNKHFKVLEIVKQAARVSELSEEKTLAEAINRTKQAPDAAEKSDTPSK